MRVFLFIVLLAIGCTATIKQEPESFPIVGTWKLIRGTLIEKGDTVVTDYTKDRSFIKMINATHFSFITHDLHHGKDSAVSFGAGAGRYSLKGDQYTEQLEYCNARE